MRMLRSLLYLLPACVLSSCGGSEKVSSAIGVEGNAAPRSGALNVPSACGDDCVGVMSAGVQWLVEKQFAPASTIVLDTAKSGVRFSGAGPGVRQIPTSVLSRLVRENGIDQGAANELAQCSREQSGKRTCTLRRGSILATMQPPEFSTDGSSVSSLLIYYDGNQMVGSVKELRWVHRTYKLMLNKTPAGWRVFDARLVETS
jgi:hypothetical protein